MTVRVYPAAGSGDTDEGAETGDDDLTADVESIPRLEPEIAPEHRLWLIVYVDNYNIDPIERRNVTHWSRARKKTVMNSRNSFAFLLDACW